MKAKEILDIVLKREELEYCCIYVRNKNKQKKYGKMRFTWFASLLFSLFLFFTLKSTNGSEAIVNQFFNELSLSVYLSLEFSGSTFNDLVINTMFTFMPVVFLIENFSENKMKRYVQISVGYLIVLISCAVFLPEESLTLFNWLIILSSFVTYFIYCFFSLVIFPLSSDAKDEVKKYKNYARLDKYQDCKEYQDFHDSFMEASNTIEASYEKVMKDKKLLKELYLIDSSKLTENQNRYISHVLSGAKKEAEKRQKQIGILDVLNENITEENFIENV